MARRSRNSSGGSRSIPARAPPPPSRNLPKSVSASPPPAPVQSGSGHVAGGFGSAVMDGLAFGTGSAVAHRAADAVFGPRVIHHETVASSASAPAAAPAPNTSSMADACGVQSKAFQECLNSYGSDISMCQFYLNALNECRRGSGDVLSA